MSNKPEFLEDQDRLDHLVRFLDGLGYHMYKRKQMYQAYDFINANKELMSVNEEAYWEANAADLENLATLSRESLKNDPTPEELEERAKRKKEREQEDNE